MPRRYYFAPVPGGRDDSRAAIAHGLTQGIHGFIEGRERKRQHGREDAADVRAQEAHDRAGEQAGREGERHETDLHDRGYRRPRPLDTGAISRDLFDDDGRAAAGDRFGSELFDRVQGRERPEGMPGRIGSALFAGQPPDLGSGRTAERAELFSRESPRLERREFEVPDEDDELERVTDSLLYDPRVNRRRSLEERTARLEDYGSQLDIADERSETDIARTRAAAIASGMSEGDADFFARTGRFPYERTAPASRFRVPGSAGDRPPGLREAATVLLDVFGEEDFLGNRQLPEGWTQEDLYRMALQLSMGMNPSLPGSGSGGDDIDWSQYFEGGEGPEQPEESRSPTRDDPAARRLLSERPADTGRLEHFWNNFWQNRQAASERGHERFDQRRHGEALRRQFDELPERDQGLVQNALRIGLTVEEFAESLTEIGIPEEAQEYFLRFLRPGAMEDEDEGGEGGEVDPYRDPWFVSPRNRRP
jgi:hypothetical protein